MLRLGILGSGTGSNFDSIASGIKDGSLDCAEVAVVLSDVENAPILEKAKNYGFESQYVFPGPYKTRMGEEEEKEYIRILEEKKVDLVVLAGFMRVVKQGMLNTFKGRIINIHPSLLPSFKGLHAWKQALEAGVKIAGCTVHFVNEDLDAGRIIKQAAVEVLDDDTPESLHARIQEQEHRIYPESIKWFAAQANKK